MRLKKKTTKKTSIQTNKKTYLLQTDAVISKV